MWRMNVFSPYFDSRTGWYPNGWVYDDAYAIYAGEELASQHPEWILKDAAGNKLYIPFACSGGSCTQYAGHLEPRLPPVLDQRPEGGVRPRLQGRVRG